MLLVGGFLWGDISSPPQNYNHTNSAYEYKLLYDVTLLAMWTSHNRYNNEHCIRYCISNISAVNLFNINKATLKLPPYSDNDINGSNLYHQSLFYQNCLLQI